MLMGRMSLIETKLISPPLPNAQMSKLFPLVVAPVVPPVVPLVVAPNNGTRLANVPHAIAPPALSICFGWGAKMNATLSSSSKN